MLIFRLYNFIRGYVVIKLENSKLRKTLNLLRRKNINMWDIEKKIDGIKILGKTGTAQKTRKRMSQQSS